jgi:hypothetical protein
MANDAGDANGDVQGMPIMEPHMGIAEHIQAMDAWTRAWIAGHGHLCHTNEIARGLDLVYSLPDTDPWGPLREWIVNRYHTHMFDLGNPAPGRVKLEPPYWMEFDRISAYLMEHQ